MLAQPKQSSVLGLPIHLCDDYVGWLRSRLEREIGTHVVTLNSEMAMLAEDCSELGEIVRNADLVIPDGSGVVFYLRLRNQTQNRCPGIELAASLLESIALLDESRPVVFYGGVPGVAEKAAAYWRQKSPTLPIIARHGYLTSEEEIQFKNLLTEQQPCLVLVGLGVPRQELWICQNRSLCPGTTWIGVGGSFDIWSGVKLRAPVWLRNNHLEWLYRLYQEPWR
ncbi:MAG: WecB/TagA/CpsF family glycosyltransferase, partial [Cyanobacteriota bacterium]|nr:WecB/TagA/CpsF family glycosyltransferase [Cyanobacteriota bacterium]